MIARKIIEDSATLVEKDGIYFSPEEAKVSYPDEGNVRSRDLEDDSFWFSHRNECIVAAVKNFPPPAPAIFDVGGGNGYVSKGLQNAGYEPVVVEPMRPGALMSKEEGIELVVCSTLEEAGFKEGSIPAIGLFDVLEHIEDDVAFLKDMHRFLAPDGRLYLTVPAYGILWSYYDEIAGHFRRYTLRRLEQTFAAAGFECDFLSYFFWFLPGPIFLTRVIPSRLGRFRDGIKHERAQREHGGGGGFVRGIIERLCNGEAARLQQGKGLPVGGSCLVAAHKK